MSDDNSITPRIGRKAPLYQSLDEAREAFEIRHEMTYHEMCAALARLTEERDAARASADELLTKALEFEDWNRYVAAAEERDAWRVRAESAEAALAKTQQALLSALYWLPWAQDSPNVQPQSASLAYVIRDGEAALTPDRLQMLKERRAAVSPEETK